MKRTILLLALASPVHASDWWQSYGYQGPYPQGQMWQDYTQQPRYVEPTQTLPNVFGGEDYYDRSDYLGTSIPNVHGGRDFYIPRY